MEIHRFLFQLFNRTGVAIEREVEEFAQEFQVQQPQKLTKAFKQSDNLVTIPIPTGIQFKYVLILGTYLADDTAIGVKKDDPAPIVVRINGSPTDHPLPQGFMAWSGGLSSLRVATTYDTNQVLVEVYLG